ncbi:sortase-like acyltransferase [Sanguibacter keddieii DSM 10542]|uniref:Sortase-like acyltransferase n=1 Tax=Sanguibacter keddieii (strain ATCC 51767 / DSM 10542 / NCFB 3025 / ST-74) TaxID=446469 RepID=D1BFA8_SANKS|nr:sortase-like acyltransferase [Sanguibacter keddieii DSM 10542]
MTPAGLTLRAMTPSDWGRVADIYTAGIATGQATFETTVPSWEAFDQGKLDTHRTVAVDASGLVVGWCAVSPISARPAYAGVVENSVYVDPAAAGHGVGGALLAHLVASTEVTGIWTIQAGIFPENTASMRLHARAGFRVVGVRERIAQLKGTWRDVALLERRSPHP